MSSLLTALSTSLGALQVAQKGVAVISGNVANAGQEGYSRKGVLQEPTLLGGDAGGVRIGGYTRASDQVLLTSLGNVTSDNGRISTQNEYLQRVQDLLGSSNDNPALAMAVEKFASAWRTLEASPEGNVEQRQVVQRGQELAIEIRRLAAGVEDLDRTALTETTTEVTNLNAALARIQELNNQISVARGRSQPSGDFEDQRDREILKVAELVKIKVFERDRGQIALYTENGYSLLDGGASRVFAYNGSVISLSGDSADAGQFLTGGKLEALVNLRKDGAPATASSNEGEEVFRKLRSQLDAVANAFLGSVASPESFAHAYDNATTDGSASPAELASGFFTGSNRTDIDIDANLLSGARVVKKTAAAAVVPAMNDTSRDYTLDGLSLTDVTYAGLASGITGASQQAARNLQDLHEISDGQEQFYKKRLQDAIGVNIDEELVRMQVYQTAYQASARLIAVINQMFETLDGIAR